MEVRGKEGPALQAPPSALPRTLRPLRKVGDGVVVAALVAPLAPGLTEQ